jgi:hypothetical protein
MDPFELHERKRQAWMRLRAQRRRAGQLRGRVVALSLITFALLWAIVFAQMTTGHDPVLGDSSSANASTGRGGSGAKTAPAETGARTDSELEAEAAVEEEAFVEAEAAAEEEAFVEAEAAEPEFVEEAPAEVETFEPEPEPLVTGQS